ncbi:MAG: cyclic pyranopterin monophosphate synthase MoaC [Deltaproteobacteria bacterium]|nr:cyclic pyranopterin monophosphate synthase MoaC [Deltaproteobacteria bacterium]
MVDIGDKKTTQRTAIATGAIRMAPQTLDALTAGALPKGEVLTCAKLAGIQAAKRTAELIPLCHNIALSWVDLDFARAVDGIRITATAKAADATGVEMEALTAVTVAALTIYDMCKAVDKQLVIGEVRLLEKSGGKADFRASDVDR